MGGDLESSSPVPGKLLPGLVWCLCGILTLVSAAAARAHTIGESYLYLQIHQEAVSGRFEIALKDLNPALGLSGTDLEITADNLDTKIAFLESYYLEHVTISGQTGPLPIHFRDHRFLNAKGGFVLLTFDLGGLDELPETLTFDYSVLFDEEPNHRGFLLVEHNWATGTFANERRISLVFSPSSRRQDFDLASTGRLRGFLAVVRLGIEHIWQGVDHILFLIALLLPAVLRREDGRWRAVEYLRPALTHIVKIVTAFTVAHSVTLSLASLDVLHLPGRWVEVIIAASIAFAAADLLVPLFRGRVWMVVAAFGLFHGFGFAGALSEMGLLSEHLGLSLFAFNLGVEIGQIAIVAALVPFLFLARRWAIYPRIILPVAAVLMILVASAWVVERAFDVDLPIRELLPPAVQKVIP